MQARQFRSLIGVYVNMLGMGLAYGMVMPSMTIRLTAMGHGEATIGAVAAMTSLAIMLGVGRVPALHARFGMMPLIVAALLAEVVVYLLLLTAEALAVWFVLSFAFGLFNAVPWLLGEVWLNAVVPEDRRGRYMGFYAGIWGVGMALGPQVMVLVGAEGPAPFLLAAAVYLGNAVVMFSLRKGAPQVAPHPAPHGLIRLARLMPVLAIYAVAGGLAETIVYAMMPVYAAQQGYSQIHGANLITAFAAGGIVLQFVFGWLADHYPPRLVMASMLALGAVLAGLLSLVGSWLWLGLLLCFVFGGVAMSVYTLAITLVGLGLDQRHLPAAHALMVGCYTAGGLIGPWSSGLLMEQIGAAAMLWFIAFCFAGCFLLALVPAGRRMVAVELMDEAAEQEAR